jgi:hypothetical protein
MAREGVGDNGVLFEVVSTDDDALHTDGGSDEYGASSYNILALGEGDSGSSERGAMIS